MKVVGFKSRCVNAVSYCGIAGNVNSHVITLPLPGSGGELLRSCLTGTEELGCIPRITNTAAILALDSTQIAVSGILNETKQGNDKLFFYVPLCLAERRTQYI